MRVCIDVQPAVAQAAGVGRYTRLLVQHLERSIGNDTILLSFFDFKRKGLPFEAGAATPVPVRRVPGRVAQWTWKTLGWPSFDRLCAAADVYHFPNFILPPLRRGRSVVTIHDLSFLRFPEFAEERNRAYLTARVRDTVTRADAIITDSEFGAAELRELLEVDDAKLFPIPLAIDPSFVRLDAEAVRGSLDRLGIDRPYLLTVGTIEPRKNIRFLVDVFERLEDFDGCLVIAGMRGWKTGPIFDRMASSPRARDIRYVEYVDDSLLCALYGGAELFVLASHYEGFGLPPLEAMACGCPVLSSTGGSLPEVLGSAALLVETFDLEQWVTAVRSVLHDSGLRERLASAGRRHANGYSWAETARRTWEVYRNVVRS